MLHFVHTPSTIVPTPHRHLHFGQWLLIVSCLIAGWTTPVLAQKTPAETEASFTADDEFDVKLFAAEPMIINPIAVDVDSRGRVWVTEGVNYRRNVSDPPDNKIKVLEDTNGDGVADKMTVFTSDLNAALGICVAGSKIYVPESPNLYVYEDANDDLIPDGPRKVLLTGFGGKNHDHGVHSQVFGPDHKLYMTQGDTGYDVTGPDGKRIAFRYGAMIRCEADGTQLEDFAVNFRNPFELGVDSFGNVWCSDNDNDGLKSVRINWILEGGNYGWFGRPEMIREADGSFNPIHHWRADVPGFVPYALITGFGSPCGMTFYEGSAFGPKFQNQLLHCDAGPREVRRYTPQRLPGVGYTAGIENIITNTDNYFRPIDICAAPDGALIVTDWYDGGVGGHAYNDPTRGRIYRVTPRGKSLQQTTKPGPYTNDADALVALASPNHATTFLARERLLASGEKAVPALQKLAAGADRTLKARALWLLDRIGGSGLATVRAELTSKDPAFRALAVRILRRHGDKAEQDILPLTSDADGEVLKEVLLGIGHLKSDASTQALIKAYRRYDGSDRYLLETLAIASRGRETEVFKAVVEDNHVAVDQRLINIVRILRPEDATKYLGEKLASANLPEGAPQALLAALSSVATPEAGKSVLGVLKQPKVSPEIRKLALEALRRNIGSSWNALKTDGDLQTAIAAALADPTVAPEALALVGDAGLKEFADNVITVLKADKSTPAARLAAIDVVTRLNLEAAGPVLADQLSSPEPRVRDASLKGLVALRDTKTLGNLLTEQGTAPPLKQQTADALAASSDGAVFLLRLIDTKKLDKPLADRVIAAAVEHPDVNVRLLYQKFIPEADRPKTLGQSFKSEDILKLAGDAQRGQAVFLRSGAASCNKCHRVKGVGADIGPDLSQIGRKYEQKALLETIMNPSAGIAPEYVPHVVETESGRVYAGFVQDQNDDRIVLKTIEGVTVQVPKGDIVEVVKQSVSLMPELVLKNVTAQDAADLLAYLVTLQATEVQATSFKVVGPFPNTKPTDRSTAFGPEKSPVNIDLTAKFPSPGGKEVGWTDVLATPATAGAPAQVDLVKFAASQKLPAENVIYYFAVTLESASAQPATLHIGSDDGIQVWLNGDKVHDAKVSRALTIGQDKVSVTLKQGLNVLLLKLDQGSGPAGLSLSAEAKANLTFRTP